MPGGGAQARKCARIYYRRIHREPGGSGRDRAGPGQAGCRLGERQAAAGGGGGPARGAGAVYRTCIDHPHQTNEPAAS